MALCILLKGLKCGVFEMFIFLETDVVTNLILIRTERSGDGFRPMKYSIEDR